MTTPLRIDEVFAFVAKDEHGEGITGFMGDMGWMPMVGADMERVDSLREMAQQIADASGKPIEVLKFSTRESIEMIRPRRA